MKKIVLLLVVLASLAGCMAVPDDGDRDGVRKRDDRRPDIPSRY